jgi:UDP-glucose 4-epimerase
MKVLVTGGAGYIGSVVTAQLLEAGHSVIVLDNLSLGHRNAVPKDVTFIKGDIFEVSKYFSVKDKIEAVLHFAAFSVANDSVKHPEFYWQNNTVGTLSLLEAMRQLRIKKLIFSSTAAVYGESDKTPITEDASTKPTNPYGMTKLTIDMAISSECKAHGLSAISLRYFNVAGAYGSYGERHDNETHLIPLILATLDGRRDRFTVFGDDYPTKDGTCIRDYIHVDDLARAHLLALDNIAAGQHKIYNLGNGNGFSNLEVIKVAEEVTGQSLKPIIGPRRAGDPAVLIASSDKAVRDLDWHPQKPQLSEIINDAWEFYKTLWN